MSMRVIIIIILVIVIVALLISYVSLLSQLSDIEKQLNFISQNETNKLITTYNMSRRVINLVKSVNKFIVSMRGREISVHKKDNEIKETIVNLSHDVRTPLTSLKGYFELLSQAESEEDIARYEKIISERIESLNDILEELFIFAKVNGNDFSLQLDKVNVSQVLIDTLISYYEDLNNLEITPNIDIEENVFGICDEQALKRVFQNIIKNILMHGSKCADVTLKSNKKNIKIIIANDYNLNECPDVSRIFDRFYKGDQSRRGNSSGIGLSVARKLIVLMNGTVSASLKEEKFVLNINLNKFTTFEG